MRILAGRYKGRTLLPPPPKSRTRPITGSVKKSLFGMLGEDLSGMTVADLYCGTGTLGLEAMSRGAERCGFAEQDRSVLARLRRNIEAIGAADRCVIWEGDVTIRLADRLAELNGPIDVAFVDPPYAHARSWSWRKMADDLFAPLAGALAADGVVILRLPEGVEAPETIGPLKLRRLRRYGDMQLALLEAGTQDRRA